MFRSKRGSVILEKLVIPLLQPFTVKMGIKNNCIFSRDVTGDNFVEMWWLIVSAEAVVPGSNPAFLTVEKL